MKKVLLVALLFAAGAVAADRSECKCGSGCECKDGRVTGCCSCEKGQCRCADVAGMSPVAYVADVALHLALAHLQNTPLADSPRNVMLADANRFGLDFHSARAMWLLVKDHGGQMRDTVRMNDPANFNEWERDYSYRYRVYYLADDVLNCPGMAVGAKLRSLEELRRLIGQEAYDAGQLPSPCPSYRMPQYRPRCNP